MFKKIASNTVSQILSKIITSVIAIFLIWILTRYLTTSEYWTYNKVYNYLSIFTFLFDMWLYTLTIREISKNKEKSWYIIWNIMALRIFVSISLIILSLWIAVFLPNYNQKTTLLAIWIVSIYSVISLFNSSVLALMQSYMKIEFSLFSLTLWKILNLIFIIYVTSFLFENPVWIQRDYAFLLIIFAWLFWLVINFLMNLFYAKKITKIRFLFDFKYIKKIFLKSLPYWIALFLSVLYFKIDVIIMSLLLWQEADLSIALYSLPMKIIEVLMFFWGFFLNSLLPSLSLYFKENKTEKIKIILENSFKFLSSLWIFVVVFFSIFSKEVINLIATEEYLSTTNIWYNSNDAFLIVIWVLAFYYIALIFNYIFISSKQEKKLLYINIIISIFNVVWNIILIPKYNFIWAWIITLLSQIILCFLWYFFSRNIIKFKINFLYLFLNIFWGIILFFWTKKNIWNF